MEEMWKQIKEFPVYEISNLGNLRSWHIHNSKFGGKKPRLLKGGFDKEGYRRAVLCGVGYKKSCRIAQLVANAFLPSPNVGEVLRHINGINVDNRVVNLEWGTQKQNIEDRTRHGTTAYGEASGKSKLTEENVFAIRESKLSNKCLAMKYAVSIYCVRCVRTGKTWKHLL